MLPSSQKAVAFIPNGNSIAIECGPVMSCQVCPTATGLFFIFLENPMMLLFRLSTDEGGFIIDVFVPSTKEDTVSWNVSYVGKYRPPKLLQFAVYPSHVLSYELPAFV